MTEQLTFEITIKNVTDTGSAERGGAGTSTLFVLDKQDRNYCWLMPSLINTSTDTS